MGYFGGTRHGRAWAHAQWHAILQRTVLATIFIAAALVLVTAYKTAGIERAALAQLLKLPNAAAREATGQGPVIKSAVYVASQHIAAGTRLGPSLFKVDTRPIQGIEDQVIRDSSELRNRFAATEIRPDTVLLSSHLAKEAPGNVITSRIPDGYRAVSIPVDAESGVEGWARPGARVDVVWSTEHRGRRLVSTIVEKAEVLSAEQSTEPSSIKELGLPKHITLMVSIRDAQRIQLAKTSGALSLNLRGDSDDDAGSAETISIDTLLRPIIAEKLGNAQGKVSVQNQEYALVDGKLIPWRDYLGKAAGSSGTFSSERAGDPLPARRN